MQQIERIVRTLDNEGFSQGSRILSNFCQTLKKEGLIPLELSDEALGRESETVVGENLRGEKLITINDAVEDLGVSRATIYARMRSNRIAPLRKLGDKKSYLKESDLSIVRDSLSSRAQKRISKQQEPRGFMQH